MNDPLSLGCDCKNCPFAKDGKPNHPVWGEGRESAKGILVGEVPTLEDAMAKRPFVGQVMVPLAEALESAGLKRADLFLCNVVLCRPSLEARKEPKLFGEAVKCCRPALLEQLKPFESTTPTLGMGKWAQRALMSRQLNMNKARGFIRWDWEIPRDN